MNRFLASAVALSVAVPVMAQGQAPVAPTPPIAPRMDVTHTRDQAVARVRDHFARMDTNRDGFVAGDEMQSVRGRHQGMKGQMAGGDHQAMGDPAKAFDRIDANRDGMISRDEFAKGREIRIERKVVMKGTPGADGKHGAMMMMHHMGGAMMRGHMLKMADVDKDGRVSLQEATTKALERFDRVDANRDGKITPEERRQHRDLRKQIRAPKSG